MSRGIGPSFVEYDVRPWTTMLPADMLVPRQCTCAGVQSMYDRVSGGTIVRASFTGPVPAGKRYERRQAGQCYWFEEVA